MEPRHRTRGLVPAALAAALLLAAPAAGLAQWYEDEEAFGLYEEEAYGWGQGYYEGGAYDAEDWYFDEYETGYYDPGLYDTYYEDYSAYYENEDDLWEW